LGQSFEIAEYFNQENNTYHGDPILDWDQGQYYANKISKEESKNSTVLNYLAQGRSE
jgi:hypothetical protein